MHADEIFGVVLMVNFSISETENKRRMKHIRKYSRRKKLDALYFTNSTSIFYLTGYSFIATERPAALVVPVDGKITFMGPLLEKDHIPLKTKIIEDVRTYVIILEKSIQLSISLSS